MAFICARQHALVLSVCYSLEMLVIVLGSRIVIVVFSSGKVGIREVKYFA